MEHETCCNCDGCWAQLDEIRLRRGWEALEAERLEKARTAARARFEEFRKSRL